MNALAVAPSVASPRDVDENVHGEAVVMARCTGGPWDGFVLAGPASGRGVRAPT